MSQWLAKAELSLSVYCTELSPVLWVIEGKLGALALHFMYKLAVMQYNNSKLTEHIAYVPIIQTVK